jgi:hypothetical protein
MKRRITRISVETEREVIVGARDMSSDSWCPQCGTPVVLIEHGKAAAALELSAQESQALIKPVNAHLVEVVKGRIRICPNSQPD